MASDGNPELVALLSRIDERLTELRDLVCLPEDDQGLGTRMRSSPPSSARPHSRRASGARHGRIRAEKRQSGRGKHCDWVIAHDELLRYRREGLLPAKH